MTRLTKNLTLAVVLLASTCVCYGKPKLVISLASKLEGTNSVVYCPTLQIAWDGMKQIVGGAIAILGQYTTPLLAQLNQGNCPTSVVPETAYVAMAGFTDEGIVDQIREALISKFGDSAPKLPPILSRDQKAIISYAYLRRRLPFWKKFALGTENPLKFCIGTEATPVQFFGAPYTSAASYTAVTILHYSGDDDFIIRLESRVRGEFIVLAKIQRPDTLLAGVEIVHQAINSEEKDFVEIEVNGKREVYLNSLSNGDVLAIPLIDLSVSENFEQLCNRPLTNKGFEQVLINQVFQDVQFKMDETGATVTSTSYVNAPFGAAPPPPKSSKPRAFLFDKPFLVTLWQANAPQPYLAIWVASTDVLLPFKPLARTR